MAKKINYASMFTLRADGRYQGYWHELDADGKPKGKRHTICDRDPEKLYQKIQEKESVHDITFAKIAEEWRGVRFEQLSYKSVEAYKAPFRRLCEQFGGEPIEKIEAADVSAFLSALGRQGYARRSVQLHRDMMSQIYNYAISERLTRYNPCDHATMPKGLSAGTRGIPSDEAIEAVRGGLDAPFGLFPYLCLHSGLRRGEALALRYEDIDRKRKVIHVTKAVEYINNNPHIKKPKTEAGKRDVLLLDVLDKAIPKKEGFIFCGEDGKLLTKEQYNARWSQYCKAIGYKLTAHQLRHGFATILYEAGIPDKDAQELLGHSDITLTRNIYTHIRTAQKSRTAEKLNAFVCNTDCKIDKSIDK